jgi:raffinose/stachyose/melibiose transport system substrate-binding protein
MKAGESRSRLGWLNGSVLSVAVLGLVVIASLVTVLRNESAAKYPGKTVIRILHWQLETGYREAIDKAIREYERQNPSVHIIQMAVAGAVYDQFLNTNLVSGSAPDIAELGKGKFNSDEQYTVRFFLPLGTYIRMPNPYNRGTAMEHVPWQETFIDGMRGGYKWQLQDYYAIAPGLFQRRFFYNKKLYRAATGSDAPPKTFGELIDVGRKVRAWGAANHQYVVPVVNAENRYGSYNKEVLAPYQIPFTSNLDELVDTNMDGEISGIETYASYVRGEWSLKNPYLAAFYGMMRDMTALYEPGFLGMDRQTAMFRFTNEQALMFYTGSWDAASVAKQCEGRFDVGVLPFPVPAPHEKYGPYVRGPATESNSAGLSGFGVYKGSAHPEVAIDFLRLLTSQPHNGPIMEIASWPPIVIGSQTSDAMKPFIPNPTGYSSRLEIGLADSGNPMTVYFNEFARFLQGEATFAEFAAAYDAAVRDPDNGGDNVWALQYASQRQEARTQERLLSIQLVREMMDPQATDAPEKYRRNLVVQVRNNVGEDYRYRFEELRHKPIERL